MARVVIEREKLPPLVYEAETVEQVDEHLRSALTRRRIAVLSPTTWAAAHVGWVDEAIDQLLGLRFELGSPREPAG